jgi:exonuclease SbcC
MLPKYVKAKGFTSYIDEVIEFEKFGDLFAVIGENGAGKSSLIDMIMVALFGRARGVDNKGSGLEDLINKNCDHFEIEYVFVMNEVEYKIVRRKFRGGAHELEFYINGSSQTEKITETQLKILNSIKVDYDTILDTICVGQGQSARFMEKKPNERKEVFSQVLGLDKYEVLEKHTKELRKEVKDKMEKTETKITNLKEKINKRTQHETTYNQSKQLIANVKIAIKNKEDELEKIVTEKAQYEQLKQQADLILNQRTNLQRKITAQKSTIDSDLSNQTALESQVIEKDMIKALIQNLQIQIEEDQKEYTKFSNEKSSLEATTKILNNQAKEYKVKYDNLKNYNQAECNFCGNIISDSHKQQYLNELMNEGKKSLNEAKANQSRICDLITEIDKIDSRLTQSKIKLRDAQAKFTKISQAETQLNGIKNRLIDSQKNLEELKKEYSENCQIQVVQVENKIFNDAMLKAEIARLRTQLTDYENQKAIAENELIAIGIAEAEIGTLVDEFEQLEIKFDDYSDLIVAWGKAGIQADIIGNALPEIEDEINNLLEILCNSAVSIEFQTQKETKNKKAKGKPASIETLDIVINDENGSRKYETYSGGEKFRVDFACHVGLSKFLAKRAGATIDFFIVDEGLGSQDENARQQFITSIYQLSKIFKQIMIITHIDEMKDAFDNRILVEKDPVEGSRVRKVS